MLSRKRQLPTSAAAASAGSAVKRVFRSSVMLLVFSGNRSLPMGDQQRSKHLSSTEKPRSDITQKTFVLAAEGASVVEADATQAAVARRAPFIDDGIFDPRRDYWGNDSSTAGVHSTAITPAISNLGAGEFKARLCHTLDVCAYVCAVVPLYAGIDAVWRFTCTHSRVIHTRKEYETTAAAVLTGCIYRSAY